MVALRTVLAGLGVVLSVASVAAQQTAAEVTAAVALFSKGRPTSMSSDDWDIERIGLFARVRELAVWERDLQTPRVAIPLLLNTLGDSTPEVAVIAAGALLAVDPASRARAVAALAAGLESGSDQAEQWALRYLSEADPVAEDIERVLTAFVRQSSSRHRPTAVQALGAVMTRRIPAVTPMLVRLLGDPEPEMREAAAAALGQFGPRASDALPALRAARGRAADRERQTLDEAIASIADPPSPKTPPPGVIVTGPTPLPASMLPSLQVQLRAPTAATRLEALRTVSHHRGGAQSLVPLLITLLEDPDQSVRYRAAYALTEVDRAQAGPALPLLSELLMSRAQVDGGPGELLASSGLARLGEPGANALMSALASADKDTKYNAIDGLATSDAFPAAAVPALLRLLSDPDELIGHRALSTLTYRKVPAAQVAGPFTALLRDPSEAVRYNAIFALAMLGSGAAQAVPLIRSVASTANADVQFAAATAVVAIQGGTPSDVAPLLARFQVASAVGSNDPQAAFDMHLASAAFIRLGGDARSAVPALVRAWEREAEPTRTYVGAALAVVDPASTSRVVSAIIDTANQGDDYLAIEALYQLAGLGGIAASGEAAVATFVTHENPRVRDAARAALVAIRSR